MATHIAGYSEDRGCTDALRALGRKVGVDTMSCSECPFPFCVVLESRRLKNLARDIMIMAMHSMHASVNVIAARAGVTERTAYRIIRRKDEEMGDCNWCRLDLKEGGVFCRSSYCTVAYDESSIAVTLSSHRKATGREVEMIETLSENMFPNGVLASANDSKHDHWVVDRVEQDEANIVYNRMSELSMYTTGLR